ncbi:MAG TPA: hypothetical protein VGH28_13680 [Polyangiaceae bacterium]|jgi:hypothetical protein
MKGLVAALALVGCAGPIDVARTVTPSEAASANGTSFHAAAIVRGQARAALPPGVTVAANEILVPRPGTFTYSLDPGEKVVRDKAGNITAVAVPKGDETAHFIAGTATLDGNEVRGELVGHVEHVPLLPDDRVELRGKFAPGDAVPTGGRVETTRAWSAFVFGSVLLGGAWLPSVIVGATSSVDANHWLYVPIIGPWAAYAARDACTPSVDPRPCLADAGERIAIIVDGILQSTSAVLLVVGLPTSATVTWGKQARLRVAPSLGGITIDGRF